MAKTKSSRSKAAVMGKGKAKKAARKWIGWEEEIRWDVEEEGEEPRKVCNYYIRRAPANGRGKRDNYLVVVGKEFGPGNMAYTAHPHFLVSLGKALKTAPKSSRVATVALEVTELRWMSRKEIMVWLTSLISDPPYGIRGLAIPDDYDGSSPASKDTLSTLAAAAAAAAVENKEGFRWFLKLPHLDQRRRHYKAFYHDGMRIALHDFVYIKSEGGGGHVAYVEDMYEYESERKMVLARWFEKVDDDHGAVLPADVHNREVFYSYGLQDLRVESVVGLATVLNSQHFEMFQQSEEGSSSQPYLCHRQIENKIVGPFDMTQLEGYEKQQIVRAIVKASSSTTTTVQAKEAPSSTTVHAITVGAVLENHGSSNAIIGDETNHGSSGTVIGDKTNNDSSGTVIGGKTMDKKKQKLKQKPPPCSTTTVAQHTSITNDQTVESNMVSCQAAQNEQPPSSNAAANLEATTVKKRHPSGGFGSGSGLRSIVLPIKSDGEPMFQPGCHIEVLCQDSSVRGCWFRCVVDETRQDDEVQVRYLDVQDADDTGNLKEWLKLTRTAARDALGIRLHKRMMIRPQFPPISARYRKLESPVAFGAVVDAKKDNRWCEGIVLGQDTEGRVKVHLQGENEQQVFEVGDLRQSIEWHEGRWKSLQPRVDVASGLVVPASQKKPAEQIAGQKPAEKLRPTAPKPILHMVQVVELEQPAKPVTPMKKRALVDSLQSASKKAEEFAALNPRLKPRGWFVKTGPPRKRFRGVFSLEEATLKMKDRENKGPAEHANPAEEKASLQQHHEEGDGSTDAKRRRLDLVNYVSIKPAELKAGTSSGGMGSPEGGNQGDIGESASNGGAMKPDELKAGTSSGGMGCSEGSSQGGITESASNGGAMKPAELKAGTSSGGMGSSEGSSQGGITEPASNGGAMKPAELKAGTSSGGMGSSQGSNQGGITESASNGGAMKPAELKAGPSSGGMGSSEGSNQGGIGESASNGGAAAVVNPVPAEGVCITNKEATVPAVSEQEVIDLTMDD